MGATTSHGGQGALQALPLGLRSQAFSHGDEDWYDDSRPSKPHYPYFIFFFLKKKLALHESTPLLKPLQ